jgi:hypothetical protein
MAVDIHESPGSLNNFAEEQSLLPTAPDTLTEYTRALMAYKGSLATHHWMTTPDNLHQLRAVQEELQEEPTVWDGETAHSWASYQERHLLAS